MSEWVRKVFVRRAEFDAVVRERDEIRDRRDFVTGQMAAAHSKIRILETQVKALMSDMQTTRGLLSRRTDQLDRLVSNCVIAHQDAERLRNEWHASLADSP